jgi:hypothetical protein
MSILPFALVATKHGKSQVLSVDESLYLEAGNGRNREGCMYGPFPSVSAELRAALYAQNASCNQKRAMYTHAYLLPSKVEESSV